MNKRKILVVGAGFSGAVIARQLADSGDFSIDVIDQRSHIAGNCFDPYDEVNKLRTHQYGPHIFHTNEQHIFTYLSRFTQWLPYRHKVEAFVDDLGFVPFPINMTTINYLYDKQITKESELKQFFNHVSVEHAKIKNARQAAENLYGKELVELFFSRYTKKMWNLDLEELPASVVARIPVRYNNCTDYFDDKYQALPKDGYISLFDAMLDHHDINVYLDTSFEKIMERNYHHVFNGMSIDEYYDLAYDALPYRSIFFDNRLMNNHNQPVPTVNLTDTSHFTRYTDWRLYPGCGTSQSKAIITYEQPCSYDTNNERFYPIKTVDNVPQKRYKLYHNLSQQNKKCTFIGRCGQYRYLDMHQVVANSLVIANRYQLSV